MNEERYGFKEVPENQRFYFLVQWDMPLSFEEAPPRSVFDRDILL